jgi:hypothetical protein
MKHVYPVRHPPMPPEPAPGETPVSREQPPEPALPHERDESSQGQARGTPQQEAVGREAYRNATDGTTDTDRGPVMDRVYNEKVAPDRGPAEPRR